MFTHRYRVVACIVTMICVTQASFTQSQYRFRHYGINDGLGYEFAWGLEQDSLGYIWEVYGGLSRFDGYNFKNYKHSPDDSLTSALDFILGRPIKDNQGNIWVTMTKEKPRPEVLAKFDYRTDGFIKHEIQDVQELVFKFLFDKGDSILWLATDNGLVKYNINNRRSQKYFNLNSEGKPRRPYMITGLKNLGSYLLMSTGLGLWKFDKASGSYLRPVVNVRDSTLLFQNRIDQLLESPNFSDGSTWLKIHESLVKVDSNLRVVQKFDFPKGVSMDQWARDSDGVFWIGSGWNRQAGLFRYDPRDSSILQFKHDPADPGSIRQNSINDVLVDIDQNVWVATDVGLSVLRRNNLEFINSRVPEGNIWGNTIYRTEDNDYLILKNDPSSNGRLLMSPIPKGKPMNLNLSPILDPIDQNYFVGWLHQGKKNFWMSAQRRGVIGYKIDPTTGLISKEGQTILARDAQNQFTLQTNVVHKVWEAPNEDLWIGQPYGLDRVRSDVPYGSIGSVTRYTAWGDADGMYPEDNTSFWLVSSTEVGRVYIPERPEDSARFEPMFKLKDAVSVLSKGNDGTLFVGTTNGIYGARKEGSNYILIDKPILEGVHAFSIQDDSLGRIWIDSKLNLICYDLRTKVKTEFDERDGIDHLRNDWGNRMYKLRNGYFLLVGSEGVSMFNPQRFRSSGRNVIPVLTKLEINNEVLTGTRISKEDQFTIATDIGVLKELVLDHKHNDFTIEFSAMEMTAPEKNLYKYKLEGYNEIWIESNYKNRTATYTNLNPGTYFFRVRASNHNGVWSDAERTLKVIILPPPWKSTWAYTAYGLLFLALLYVARRNIVQRERLKSNLKLAKVEQEREHFELEKAKEVDKVKSTFFANISHEFRTPLTLIKGPVEEMLEEFGDHPKVKERMKLIQRNADLVLKLINQLLDLAKLDSGTLTVEKTQNDLNTFISVVVASFSSLAFQKNITLETELPQERKAVSFDKGKVETILINLINNAIKFTPSGGKINVYASLNNDKLVLVVADNGIGIDKDQHEKIFERFHQVSEAHKEVGTGIGLSLVKELVALMQGNLSLKSEPGKGSEFTVVLPVEVTQVMETVEEIREFESQRMSEELVQSMKDISDELPGNRPRILVVEDNSDLRKFIIDSLGNEFQFLEAPDGKQGLSTALEETPDLIISDVMMPEMDGMTMTGKIKNDTRTSHIPLILLTAKTTDESKLQGLGTGADDYLTKPFNKNELLLKVRNSIASRIKLREKIKLELLTEGPRLETQSADEQFLYKVRETILSRLGDEQFSVESLAEEMALSRSQLLRKVTALTGMSVNELIRTFRLQKAAQFLEQSWGPVTQVAYEVGFSNLSYFSKAFKDQYGVLPSEYQAQLVTKAIQNSSIHADKAVDKKPPAS